MKNALMIVAMVAVIGMAGAAHAGTVYNYVSEGVENTPADPDVTPPVSGADLLNGLTPVVTGTATIAGAPWGAIGVATDGLWGNAAGAKVLPLGAVGDTTIWTYTLGAASNVGEVRLYSADNNEGNIGARAAYDYDIEFLDAGGAQIGSTITVVSGYGGTLDAAGSGTGHVRGTQYSAGNPPDFNQTHYTQVADDAGFLATGVSKVRFTLRPVRVDDTGVATLATAIGHTWVSEIDVFADAADIAAPIPEPAGLGLIGLALLAVRRRRS